MWPCMPCATLYEHGMRWVLVVLLINAGTQLFGEQPVDGTWHRNVPFAEATLKVDPSLHFHIDASYAANFGEVDGELHLIKNGIYYSVVDDEGLGRSCLFVMSVDNGRLTVTLYGDEIGAGVGVYYEGNYQRKAMTRAQFRREALHRILPKGLRQNTVARVLGDNLDHFIQCLAVTSSIPSQDKEISIAYEGFSPGVADSENGLVAVGPRYFFLLFQDVRNRKTRFQYYTNAPSGTPLPKTLRHWIGGRTSIPIRRHYVASVQGG